MSQTALQFLNRSVYPHAVRLQHIPLRSRQIDALFPGDPLCLVRTVEVLSDIDVRVVPEKLDKSITLTSDVESGRFALVLLLV